MATTIAALPDSLLELVFLAIDEPGPR